MVIHSNILEPYIKYIKIFENIYFLIFNLKTVFFFFFLKKIFY